jgi:hypothetical protein
LRRCGRYLLGPLLRRYRLSHFGYLVVSLSWLSLLISTN